MLDKGGQDQMPKASGRGQRRHRDDPPAEKPIGLYHVVYPHEGFNEAATALFEVVRGAEQRSPGQRRVLYLDIDGHRNDEGGYDLDMYELQTHFVVDFLMPFLTESHLPIGLHIANPKPHNDVPDMPEIRPAGS
jgi:hypothetical protein